MMTLKETEDMQRAVDTVDRLLQMDMGRVTASIRPESLRVEANAAMNRVLKAAAERHLEDHSSFSSFDCL